MVKGISRQVIVVQSPDTDLFEQAIFILRSSAVGEGVTEERLLQEAEKIVRGSRRKRSPFAFGAFWALCGGGAVGLVWLIVSLI